MPSLSRLAAVAAPLCLALSACATPPPITCGAACGPQAGPMLKPWGYPLDALDRDTRPQDDFYQFANGTWLSETDIPADRSGAGFSFTMRDRNDARIAEIVADLTATAQPAGSDGQKIADLYADFMDVAAIEANGLWPIEADLDRIRAAETHEEIAALMGDAALGLGGLFSLYVTIDSRNPETYTMGAAHSGLGMPDRTYYLRPSDRLKETRAAYQQHLARMLDIAGETEVAARADAVFALETGIAEAHWTRAQRRNADRTYNRMNVDALSRFAPGFPWRAAMAAHGLPTEGEVVIREVTAFPDLAKLFAETPVSVWRDYLLARAISNNAAFLPDTVYQADFEFYGKALSGQQQPRPRDKRAIALVNGRLDQAVGKEYIDRYFPEQSKVLMTEMFENIRTALRQRIDGLEWMGPETKVRAKEKLAAMTAKIAYPEVWEDYSALEIVPGDLVGNIKRHRAWSRAESVARLGTKVDKREWIRAPQTVNAFYSPTRNEAFIPAGYIQSPLFDPAADPAINYGAIGSIVGHEIGHGFDDQGSKYDAEGRLQSWWTDEDRAAFDGLGDRLADQFSKYEPLPTFFVNGRQTLGENIGDLAGMVVTYHAYLLSLDGSPPPVLDGFTGEQRIFLGRAQARRFQRTEESLRQRLLSAPHSPMKLRVNGIIRNMDEFHEAFDTQPGDGMYLPPEERVKIW